MGFLLTKQNTSTLTTRCFHLSPSVTIVKNDRLVRPQAVLVVGLMRDLPLRFIPYQRHNCSTRPCHAS